MRKQRVFPREPEVSGIVFTPQQLVDPNAAPDWPTGDYSSPEYKASAARHTAYETQKERMLEEVAVAKLLARRRLPLDAVFAGTVPKPVFCGPMAADDPRVTAWREVLEGALHSESLRVYVPGASEDEEERLDYDATVRKTEDALACLRLLKEAAK